MDKNKFIKDYTTTIHSNNVRHDKYKKKLGVSINTMQAVFAIIAAIILIALFLWLGSRSIVYGVKENATVKGSGDLFIGGGSVLIIILISVVAGIAYGMYRDRNTTTETNKTVY